MFEYSLVAGLTDSGADAYLLHVTTTPSVAYIARVDDFDCGILVRESGTEPVVRVMVEAPDHDTCQKYVSEVVNVICEKGYKA